MKTDTTNPQYDIPALVASGDLFITLATMLETAAQQLVSDVAKLTPELENVTAHLLYLQRHYEVKPKAADFHQ